MAGRTAAGQIVWHYSRGRLHLPELNPRPRSEHGPGREFPHRGHFPRQLQIMKIAGPIG